MTARKRILLTGGAGYIGSHIAVALLETRLYSVTILDSFVNSKREVVEAIRMLSCTSRSKDIEIIDGDIRDRDLLLSTFEKHEKNKDTIAAVIHLAGLKDVGEGEHKPELYHSVNVGGTAALLEAMIRAGCHNLVFSSSAAVYGNAKIIPAREDYDPEPVSVYGKTKLAAERIIGTVCLSHSDFSSVALRYFNPAGAHPSGKLGEDPRGLAANLPARLAQIAARGDTNNAKIQIFGSDYDTKDGTGLRDYIHIMDLAEGHVKALRSSLERPLETKGQSVINIGSGQEQSVLDLVKGMEKASGFSYEIEYVTRRQGDVSRLSADTAKAEEELGFKASYPIEAMCEHLWNWQKKHPDGYAHADAPAELTRTRK